MEMRKVIRSRYDLTFVDKVRPGRDNYWNVKHSPQDCWHKGIRKGEKYADELMELAATDPVAAYVVLKEAPHRFSQGGWGEETGFMEQIARYALAGLMVFGKDIPDTRDAKKLYEIRMEELLAEDDDE